MGSCPVNQLAPPGLLYVLPAPLEVSERVQGAIADQEIYLRPYQTEDGFPLYEATRESIGPICTWMTWCSPEYSLQDCASFISKSQADWQTNSSFCFGIFSHEDDTLLGSIGLTRVDHAHRLGNLGIWVRSSRGRQGIAPRATRLLARFAFESLKLQRIEILVAANNLASIRAAIKAGARMEAVLRNRLVLAGQTQDAVMCSLTPQDLLPA